MALHPWEFSVDPNGNRRGGGDREELAVPAFSLQRRIICIPLASHKLSASAMDTGARSVCVCLQRRVQKSRVLQSCERGQNDRYSARHAKLGMPDPE